MRKRRPRALWAVVCSFLVGFGLLLSCPSAAAQQTPLCPTPRVYRVQPGDTLAVIAQRFGTDVPTLVALNGLADPDHIFVGQVIRLPCPVRVEEQVALAALAGVTVGEALPVAVESPWALFWQAQWQARRALSAWPEVQAIRWAPLRPTPGDTVVVRVWLKPEVAATPEVRIGEEWFPFAPTDDGYVAFVPLHGFVEPGFLYISVRLDQSPERVVEIPVWVQERAFLTQYIMLPEEKGSLLDPQLVQAEWERLQEVWQEAGGPPVWRGPFGWPIDPAQYPTTDPYGSRRSYNGGPVRSYHTGQDIAAPEGTPVYAPAPGKVLLAEPLTVRGNAVVIGHGAGVTTNYWHLSAIAVKAGQPVDAGDLIGYVGTTGLSTGAHLHWEVRIYGVPVDPVPWTRGLPLWP